MFSGNKEFCPVKVRHLLIILRCGRDSFAYGVLQLLGRKDLYSFAKTQDVALQFVVENHIHLENDIAFLPMQSDEAHAYWDEMNYCVEFALCNRRLMMQRICQVIGDVYPDSQFEPMINIAHNYACWENHFDERVIVHRKGATRACLGETGIIPGSQGTKSYIVEGLGNPDSFQSCSHGAGRLMSRTEAVRNLSLTDEIAKLEAQGIVHAIRGQKDLEEAAGAYKNISEVMANQTDLVKIVTELSPVAVIKG